MDAPGKAVFLSYASQDAAAVARVRDALEAAGLEVWLDQAELKGGDAWDAAIRKRIRDCALFVPLVSPATDARDEGYFRLEWKLAVDRSHLFAEDRPFLLPAVLDGTSQQTARVPDRFHDVQWSRASSVEEVAAFALHVARLLEGSPVARPRSAVTATQPVADQPSIAVLPFLNMSSDADNEYFADGLSEELLNVLANIRGLRVTSRTSAFSFKGSGLDLATVARRLGVSTVLEGSVRRAGKRVRITAQLIEAATDAHLWSRTYDRELDDIFAVQDEIAQAVVTELKGKLLGAPEPTASSVASEVKAATVGRTANAEAHELFLQARFRLYNWSLEANAHARKLLERAVALDPRFAMAWVGLSTIAFSQAAFADVPAAEGFARARAAARTALEIEPGLAEAHVCMARVLSADWKWDEATAALERARALAPHNPMVLRALGRHASHLGRPDEAVAHLREAITLDPLYPANHFNIAGQLMFAGRFEEAEAAYQRVLELNPDGGYTHGCLAMVYLLQGRLEQALQATAREKMPVLHLSMTAMIEHTLGHRTRSDEALAALVAGHRERWRYQIALVCSWRREADAAFRWLDEAVAAHESGMDTLLVDPFFASIRGDPRWPALLARIGLPPQAA